MLVNRFLANVAYYGYYYWLNPDGCGETPAKRNTANDKLLFVEPNVFLVIGYYFSLR